MIKPVIALTLGDPAGIGPEIVLKALRKKSLNARYRLVVVGDAFVLRGADDLFPRVLPFSRSFSRPALLRGEKFPCLLECGHPEFRIPRGRVDARCGKLSLDYVRRAAQLALWGAVEGIVTAPIHKQAWMKAGSRFSGHTEFLAHQAGVRQVAMAFYARNFLTVLLTIHLPLKKAISLLSSKLLEQKTRLAHQALGAMGRRHPRLAVAGLNPHAGEGGLLGDEELKLFVPVIRRLKKQGLNISGPYPADTLYLRAAQGEFDAVIAPYHDQALLAVKTLSFGHATNITLGLPFVRTSVDHGTAFDIAGQGVASEEALLAAIERCGEWVLARRRAQKKTAPSRG